MANLDYFSDEDVISFTLLDARTVERLQREGDIKLPKKKVDIPKDERWNTKQMSSKLLQGILAGDDISTIAKSLTQVIGNNAAAAVRNARTMVTGAENVGRLDSYEDLAEKGVVQKKVWIATADDRTRESHLLLDGEEVDIDKPFSNGLMYPADPSGDPSEVYNCRCSMRDHIVGFRRADGSISYVGVERDTTSHAGKIEDEIAQRGLEKVAVKESFEPVEITAADWESWAVDPEPYKAVISGEPVPNYSQGSKLTAEEKQRIESVALQMQERAETETVNFDTLFRGESYPTLKEAQEKYAVGNIVVNDTLTSYATSSDIAMEYAKQGEGVNVVITNTNVDNSFNGFVGVMTDPLDVGGSEEVITAKGMESKVFSSYYDKDTNTLYVGMTTDSVPAEAPAASAGPEEESDRTVVNGSDISESWTRRPDEFDFEIEDVVDAQGFNGLPKVVNDEEFQRYVEDSNIIMQRGYAAPDPETLKLYQDELYNGEWYLECSGGSAYGKGMYAAYNTGIELSQNTMNTANAYGGGPNGIVETMTLDSSAKIISYRDAEKLVDQFEDSGLSEKMQGEFIVGKVDEIFGDDYELKQYVLDRYFSQYHLADDGSNSLAWYRGLEDSKRDQVDKTVRAHINDIASQAFKIADYYDHLDAGTVAALYGYDAVRVKEDAGYIIILNRTKLIIKGK